MLHVTNGDSAAAKLRAVVKGEVLPWRDVLHDGPVPAVTPAELRAVRARHLAARFGVDELDAHADMEARDEALLRADRVVLWFEHDLYDQLQLLQVLSLRDDVEAAVSDAFLLDVDLRELRPAPVTPGEAEAARATWGAFTGDDPRAWTATTGEGVLRHVPAAMRRLAEELPWTTDGLTRSQRQLRDAENDFARANEAEEAPSSATRSPTCSSTSPPRGSAASRSPAGGGIRARARPCARSSLGRVSPEPPFLVMGVVNVTPDSFSDGGRYLDAEAAIAHGRELAAEGADILDVGGESTRPGAEPVTAEEEIARVEPVIAALARTTDSTVSIDTTKSAVARAALGAGAGYVNDVSALRFDPDLAGVVADSGARCCLMHMRGEPRTMQDNPRYDDVVSDVKAHLEERIAYATAAGIAEERIDVDPGIGFGKTLEHNLELLRRLDEIVALGRPVVVGTSRKSFLGRLTGRGVEDRVPGTIATNVLALERGATIFRVHDVAPIRDALAIAAATLRRWPTTTTSDARSTTGTTTT